jgi:hypothetical protein
MIAPNLRRRRESLMDNLSRAIEFVDVEHGIKMRRLRRSRQSRPRCSPDSNNAIDLSQQPGIGRRGVCPRAIGRGFSLSRAAFREIALLERPRLLASGIFRDSIRAFADGDCELARTLKFKDRELDDAVDQVIERLSARASFESDAARSCLDLIFIARALERIGDNSTSIAEDSFWRDQGDDIRHSYPPKKAKPD